MSFLSDRPQGSCYRGDRYSDAAELQAHHLIEQRFAGVLGQNARQALSVAVTPAEHQAFTNAGRAAISYGAGTAHVTEAQIMGAARKIYADYPVISNALGF